MPYRNKTYVAFASEDINYYYLMKAWREHDHIDFDFFDAHDLNTARDTSLDDTIKRRLRERLNSTKQVIYLVSEDAMLKSRRSASFLYHEIDTIARLGLPVVFANINQSRLIQTNGIPLPLRDQFTVSVSFQAKIIQHALDGYISEFESNRLVMQPKIGPHLYGPSVYDSLGL